MGTHCPRQPGQPYELRAASRSPGTHRTKNHQSTLDDRTRLPRLFVQAQRKTAVSRHSVSSGRKGIHEDDSRLALFIFLQRTRRPSLETKTLLQTQYIVVNLTNFLWVKILLKNNHGALKFPWPPTITSSLNVNACTWCFCIFVPFYILWTLLTAKNKNNQTAPGICKATAFATKKWGGGGGGYCEKSQPKSTTFWFKIWHVHRRMHCSARPKKWIC